MDEIQVIIRGDAKEAVQAVNSVLGAIEKLAGSGASALGQALNGALDLGNKAREAAGTIGILGGAFEALSVKAAASFETSLAKIQGLALNSQTAAQDIGKVRDQMLDLATRVPQPLGQLADAYYHVLSAGVQVGDAEFVTEKAARAAAAGHADLSGVLNTVVGAMNAYNVNLRDSNVTRAEATHFTDVMTKSVQLGNVEFGAMAGAIGRVLPMAHALGLSIESAAADMSVLTHAGLNADEAATQLSAVMSQMIQQPKQGRTELALLGTSYNELLDIMRRTPAEAKAVGSEFSGLTGTFKFLQEHLQAGTNSIDEYDQALHHVFPNVRALRDYLTSWESQGVKFENIFGQLQNSTGVVDNAFAVLQHTLQYWLAQIKNDISEVLVLFGTPMLAPLEAGAQKVAAIINDIITTMKAHPDWVAEASQVLALVSAFGLMAGGLMTLHGALALVGTSVGGVFLGVHQLTDGLFTILEPLGLVGAAVLAFNQAWEHNWFGFRDTLKDLGFQPILDSLTSALGKLGTAADQAIHGQFADAWKTAQQAFHGFVQAIQSGELEHFFDKLGPRLGGVATDLLHGLADALQTALPLIGDIAGRLVEALAHGLSDAAPKVLGGVQDLLNGILTYLNAHASDIGEELGQVFGKAGTYVLAALGTLVEKVGAFLLNNVGTLLEIGVKFGLALLSGIAKGIDDGLLTITGKVAALRDMLEIVGAALAGVFLAGKIEAAFAGMGTAISGLSFAFQAVAAQAATAGEAIALVDAEMLTTKVGGATTAVVGLGEALVALRGGIASGIGGLLSMINPVTAIITVIAAAGAALYVLNDHFGIFDTTAQVHARGIQQSFEAVKLAARTTDPGTDLAVTLTDHLRLLLPHLKEIQAELAHTKTDALTSSGDNLFDKLSASAKQTQKDIQTNIETSHKMGASIDQITLALTDSYGPFEEWDAAVQKAYEQAFKLTPALAAAKVASIQLAAAVKIASTEMQGEFSGTAEAGKQLSSDITKSFQDAGDAIRQHAATAEAAKKLWDETAAANVRKIADEFKRIGETEKELGNLNPAALDPENWKKLNSEYDTAGEHIKQLVSGLKDAHFSEADVQGVVNSLINGIDSPDAQARARIAASHIIKSAFSDQHVAASIDLQVDADPAQLKGATEAVKHDIDGLTKAAEDARSALIALFDKNPAVQIAVAEADSAKLKLALDSKRLSTQELTEADKKLLQEDEKQVTIADKVVKNYHDIGTAMADLATHVAKEDISMTDVTKALKDHGVSLEEVDALFPGTIDHWNHMVAAQQDLNASTGALTDTYGKASGPLKTLLADTKDTKDAYTSFNKVQIDSKGALNDVIPLMAQNGKGLEDLSGLTGPAAGSWEVLTARIRDHTVALGRLHDGTIVVLDPQKAINGIVREGTEDFNLGAIAADGYAKNIGTTAEQTANATPKAQAMHQAFDEGGKAASDYAVQAKGLGEALGVGVTKGIDAAVKALDPLGEKLKKSGQDAGKSVPEGAGEGIRNAVSAVTDPIMELGQRVDQNLHTALDFASPSQLGVRAGASVPEGVAAGINRGVLQVAMAIAALGITVVGDLAALGPQFFATGSNAGAMSGAGLAQGIMGSIGAVRAAGAALAQAAIDATAITLQVHSPSAVYDNFGQQSGHGLIQGTLKMLGAVASTARSLIMDGVIGPAVAAFTDGGPQVQDIAHNVGMGAALAARQGLADGGLDPNGDAGSTDNLGNAAVTTVGDGMTAAADPAAQKAADAVSKIASAFKAGMDALASIMGADLPGDIAGPAGAAAGAMRQLFAAFSDQFWSITDAQADHASKLADAAQKVIGPFKAVIDFAKSMTDLFQQLADTGQSLDAVLAAATIERLMDVLGEITNRLLPWFESMNADAADKAGKTVDAVTKIITALKDTVDLLKTLHTGDDLTPAAGSVEVLVTGLVKVANTFALYLPLLNQSGVEAGAKVVDSVQKVVGVLKAGIDLLKALHTDSKELDVPVGAMEALAHNLIRAVNTFSLYLPELNKDGERAGAQVVDALTKVMSGLKAGIDLLKALHDNKELDVPVGVMETLAHNLIRAVNTFSVYLPELNQAGMKAGAELSDVLQKVLSSLKAGIDLLKALSDDPNLEVRTGVMETLAHNLIKAINTFALYLPELNQAGMEAGAGVSDAVQKILAGLKAGVDTFKGMSELVLPSDALMQAFVDELVKVVNNFQTKLQNVTPEAVKAGTAAGDLVSKIMGGINSAMSAFKTAADLTHFNLNALQGVIDQVINALPNFVHQMAAKFEETRGDDSKAAQFAATVQAVMSAISTALGAVANAKPADFDKGMGTLTVLMNSLVTLMKQTLLPRADDFKTGAQKMKDDILAGVKLIQDSIQEIAKVIPSIIPAPGGSSGTNSPSPTSSLPAFADGGHTGAGSGRGDGGFLAWLHPDEMVVPLRKPRRAMELLGQAMTQIPAFDNGGWVDPDGTVHNADGSINRTALTGGDPNNGGLGPNPNYQPPTVGTNAPANYAHGTPQPQAAPASSSGSSAQASKDEGNPDWVSGDGTMFWNRNGSFAGFSPMAGLLQARLAQQQKENEDLWNEQKHRHPVKVPNGKGGFFDGWWDDRTTPPAATTGSGSSGSPSTGKPDSTSAPTFWNGIGNLGQGVFDAQQMALQAAINAANPGKHGDYEGNDAGRADRSYYNQKYGNQPPISVTVQVTGGIMTAADVTNVVQTIAPEIRRNLYSSSGSSPF